MDCLECTHSAPPRCSTCGGLEGYGAIPPCDTCKARGPIPTIDPPPLPGPFLESDSGKPADTDQ